MMPPSDNAQLRRWVYALLIVTSIAGVCGRIMSTGRSYDPGVYRAEGDVTSSLAEWPKIRPEPTPTHGANDRSRWATVRALVDNGTYVIGHREFDEQTGLAKRDPTTDKIKDEGIVTEDGWGTIDKVLKP
ncbi:MAG TPA: hypothetical protein VGZ25_15880, partial [Gemmataceae bacterium]|nr:hypothetical protein [Gemmataceae bacterium]